MSSIQIVAFSNEYEAAIDEFMTAIANEFEEPILTSDPTSKKLSEMALLLTDKYWIALSNGKAIGTIGLIVITNNTIVLKRMFIAKKFRGKGVAKQLLDTLLAWAMKNSIKTIYLGTMNQFKAAQKFYAKSGFTKIEPSALPFDFPLNPVDTVFYQMNL